MAYADYSFYSGSYYGDVLEPNTSAKWFEMASDELDAFTFGRLSFAFPTVPSHADKVKKAVCAIAEALYFIDSQRRAGTAQKAEDGTYHGAVASISSGKESISYAAPSATASAYTSAASSEAERAKLIGNIACKYLANIPDANGINLLYAGG